MGDDYLGVVAPRRVFSEEHRRKLSEARKRRVGPASSFYGKRHSDETKRTISAAKTGKPGWAKGLTSSPESRRKMSLAQTGKTGPLASNWQGGKTAETQRIRNSRAYAEWRTAVFERDNYTCVLCGRRGGRLNADHIKRFADHPELRLDINNGRTLCEGCHRTTPTYGGGRQATVE